MAADIRHWLEGLGLGKHADLFAENDLDFDVLPDLTDDELKELGLSLGHRKKLRKAAADLAGAAPTAATAAAVPGAAADRRQLTVMFCDLVGSTALSQRLDPEDLRDVMRRYQDAVAGAVTRYGGHVAKFLGDGVLAYFGWPQAHEDQAERAVRSGLAAIEAVRTVQTNTGENLAARVGIASGQVVVGDLVGEGGMDADAVTGATPNRAARLQQVGDPGHVIICAATRELVGQTFHMTALPPQNLKGFAEPVPAWLVGDEAATVSRFEAAHGQSRLPFIGHQGELNMLLDRWETAKGGEGQVVMVSGEAGIGKSRLTQALYENLASQQHLRLRYQCAPYHDNSAYYPIIRQLEYAAGLAPDDNAGAKLDKLESLLDKVGDADAAVRPLFAALLSIPHEDRYGAIALEPLQRKQRTETAIIDHLMGLAAQQPVLAVFEDVHWIDPTTLGLLHQVIEAMTSAAVLLVITHRPEFTPPWGDLASVTSLPIRRLSQTQVEEMIRGVGGADLSSDKIKHIMAHGDGVPLYIEELTHNLANASDEADSGEVPANLQASLTARLDRVGGAKRTAEIAAIIGREVSHQLLAAASPLSEGDLRHDLDILLGSGLLWRDERGREVHYVFKHALVQDAAYQMLLRERRRTIHADVARALETDFPNRAETEPELLAHHYDAGQEPERAAHLWLRAGRQSLGRSAVAEATVQAKHGLAALERVSGSREHDSLEIDLQICLALASMAHLGYGAEETEWAYQRARDLLAGFTDDPRHITVLHGFCALYGSLSRFHDFLDISRELLDRAERSGNGEAICVGHRCMAVGYNSRGEFAEAHEASLKAIEYFDPRTHRDSTQRFPHDIGVAAKMHLAIATQFLGHGQQAARLVEDGLALAHELKHQNTLGFAYHWACLVRLTGNQLAATVSTAETMTKISIEAANPNWLDHSRLMHGAALAASADTAALGVEQIEASLEIALHEYMRTIYQCFQARGLLHLGRHEQAGELIERCLCVVGDTAERWWEAELHRIHGEVRHAQGGDAEICFQRAIEVARRQAAKLLELRAASSLAELWLDQGKRDAARELVMPIHGWFTEGLDAPDLLAAQALLDKLA